MNRREFLRTAGALAATMTLNAPLHGADAPATRSSPTPTPQHLPRWRGFNLLEKFTKRRDGNPPFREEDFAILSDWGFNFVRLPMSYLCWTDPKDWMKIEEPELRDIDGAVQFGAKHGVHVNLNFHRAPGYCVNPPKEPLDLWTDDKALEACCFHWSHFARRYKGIPNSRLSFDLLNEPAELAEATYVRVVKALVDAIRKEDPNRLIIADGLRWGNSPVPGLVGLDIAQSVHCYQPMQVSHFRASWIHGSDTWPEPTWPLHPGRKNEVNKATLHRDVVEPWKKLEARGVGIHVGEWGAFNRTPHPVVLAWMRDCLDLWKEAGWGWALWNLRGGFGVLDSDRADVEYEDFHGHKLDRAMLRLLQGGA